MATREFAQLQSAFDHMLHRFNETRAALDAQMAEERRVLEEVRSLQRQGSVSSASMFALAISS